MNIKEFILSIIPTDKYMVDECLDKATIIEYEDEMLLVADSLYIYYWGASENKRLTMDFYRFFKKHQGKMRYKTFFTKDEFFLQHPKHIIDTGMISEDGSYRLIFK
jgi:hypothetical protein